MKKLQILVPQYRETTDIIKPLLDSIALQQRICFDDVGVIIASDGGETLLPDDFLKSYPFDVEYVVCPHRGVSATRNAAFDRATADYVMFCDADDMFYNMCGIWILFREMATAEFDSLTSCFTEETKNPNGNFVFVNHDIDSTFVHGKVHRRQYLIDNNIRFNDNLTIHEDSYFNILCQNMSENVKYCPTPFYLWRWRDESVCRHDPKYILKTFRNMIDSNDALVDEFERRGKPDKAQFYAGFMIFDSYYAMNKPEWINQENKEYRHATELRFRDYYNKHREKWEKMSIGGKMQLSNAVRARTINEGMLMETETITDWLRKVQAIK